MIENVVSLSTAPDGTLIEQQAWDGSNIEYVVDGLSLGTYNFTLEILDAFGTTASHTVWVEVISGTTMPGGTTNTSATTTTTNGTTSGGIQEITLIVSLGSTVVIIVIIVLMLKTKRNP